ncbi:ADP-ribosyltransferase domain-containing protein, partial [Enterobacter cloacae complex sp. 2DZ2F20B]
TFEKQLGDGKTLEIYVDFNKQCRELKNESSWIKFPYKSFYCLLGQAVSSVQSVPDNNQPPYYRGVSFHYDPNFPDEEILVDFAQFTSCSKSRQQALSFINSQGGKGTLLILPHPPMAGIGIKNYSQFAQEEEVLICPWSTFTIR